MRKLITLLFWLFVTPKAFAFPEMARLGYFSCSACHASPAGGGALTAYGHGIASDRLSAFPSPSIPMPEWLIAGSDSRAAIFDVQSPQGETVKRVRMQDDYSLGVRVPHFATLVEGGILGQSEAAPDRAGKPALRQYWAMGDYGNVALRAGRFFPRFGLNIPQHIVNIRDQLGFDDGEENHAVELSSLTESDEVSLTGLAGVKTNNAEPTGNPEKGGAASWYHYLFGKHRIGASVIYGKVDDHDRLAYGLSGVIALPGTAFLLAESDIQKTTTGELVTYQGYSYGRLGFEPYQGIIPFLSWQCSIPDTEDTHARTDTYLLGFQFYPYPYFEFEGAVGPVLNLATYSYTTESYLMAHVYL